MFPNYQIFRTFTEAYPRILKNILDNGEWVAGVQDPNSVGSHFGTTYRRTKEILAYTFCVENPSARYVDPKDKELNQKYYLANFLWMLLGIKDAYPVVIFNSKGKRFVNAKGELASAVGPHIFKLENGVYSQFEGIVHLLKKDPASRRAVIQLLSPKDIYWTNRDLPCYNHVQFFVRKKQLHSHVVMRSQNASGILPYDFFLFSLLHESLSVRLNLKLGKIYYTCNSIHVYEDEVKEIKFGKTVKRLNHTKMTNFDRQMMESLKLVFLKIVKNKKHMSKEEMRNMIKVYKLDKYWTDLIVKHFAD